MTVEVQTKKVTANGNDVATTFSFSPIVIFESGNLVVTKKDSDDVETVLSEGSSSTTYSVSVSTFPGTGSITYPASGGTPLATGETITIKRVLTIEQTLDLENQGGYFPDNQETQFDKLVMIDLQQQEELDRAFKLPVSDTSGSSPEIQSMSGNANKYLRVNTAEDQAEWAAVSTADASASDIAPENVSLSAADAGVAADFSREDHVHLLPTVSVAKGGTGATTASAARTNLGLVIGTDVQADLDVVSQVDAEAGTATDERVWTAQRVGQAIAALAIAAATQSDMETASSTTVAVTPGRQHFHPGHPKVWVKFAIADGSVTADYGVSSVDDDGTGDWGVNFTTAFSSGDYAHAINALTSGLQAISIFADAQNTGSLEIISSNNAGAASDGSMSHVTALVLGDL